MCDPQKVHLFTGDGGFDFSVDYEKQERSVYPLLIASAIIGVQVLLIDGMFVLKLFDIFSVPTQYFLRLVTLCFKEWTLYKPSTSRPCNSERYLLCRGFRRGPSILSVLDLLTALQKKFNEGEYPQTEFFSFFTEKEKEFLESHMNIYSTLQSKTLVETIDLQNMAAKDFSWKPHHELAVKWCRVFRVPTSMKGWHTSRRASVQQSRKLGAGWAHPFPYDLIEQA